MDIGKAGGDRFSTKLPPRIQAHAFKARLAVFENTGALEIVQINVITGTLEVATPFQNSRERSEVPFDFHFQREGSRQRPYESRVEESIRQLNYQMHMIAGVSNTVDLYSETLRDLLQRIDKQDAIFFPSKTLFASSETRPQHQMNTSLRTERPRATILGLLSQLTAIRVRHLETLQTEFLLNHDRWSILLVLIDQTLSRFG